MHQLWKVYHHEIPDFILEFANTQPMLRLKDIGMNCGCEYTRFPIFKKCQPYSRYDHSIGAALIVWHFTHDKVQTISALLHDVAAPVFAHTIDFLNGDYERQESTEENTAEIIAHSSELMLLLVEHGLKIAQVSDYHMYPIADNDMPCLSADRLEYSLGNILNYGFCSIGDIEKIYHDIAVYIHPDGTAELAFRTKQTALQFTKLVLKNAYVYISDADRFAMQALADIVKEAIDCHVIEKKDLYKNEAYVIKAFQSDEKLCPKWRSYTQYCKVNRVDIKPLSGYWVKVSAKKRYIDPFVINQGRASVLSKTLYKQIEDFKNLEFNYYLSA